MIIVVLYHHGIKGQKWGVRRFQNRDGTWTPEGKERRNAGNDRDREFELTEGSVIQRLSNNYEKFNKQPIDISAVKARGGLNNSESLKCVSLATKKFTEASKLEPQIVWRLHQRDLIIRRMEALGYTCKKEFGNGPESCYKDGLRIIWRNDNAED